MAQPQSPEEDPFDSLLTLESHYQNEGYNLGLSDGATAGRTEGRTFGLQNGFSKHLEFGRLGGRAKVWKARTNEASNNQTGGLTPLDASERLKKHISRLCELTDPTTLSTENSEDAVEEFEGRERDARAKATLISKAVGENGGNANAASAGSSQAPKRGLRAKGSDRRAGAGGEMEDFAGTVPISKPRSSFATDQG